MGTIYCIVCLKNNKKYIGSSTNMYERMKAHYKSSVWRKKNNPLYGDMKLYGREQFIWGVLEVVDEEDMLEREKHWIREYNTIEEGYNILRPYLTEEEKREYKRWNRNFYRNRSKYTVDTSP
jgi:group I intron endonuclease